MNFRPVRSWIVAVMLFAVPLLLKAAEQARVGHASDLRATPHSDAVSIKSLDAGSTVEVLQRQGGWYQVKSGEQAGWVRMPSLQFGDPAARADGAADDPLGFLRSGRSSVTEATPTTGVRGLDDTDLAQATPNLGAVAQLDQFAAKEADARVFASQAPVKSVAAPDLPATGPK